MSCACDSSTSFQSQRMVLLEIDGLTIRAAGCNTAMCLRIVAPSLVMTTSPVPVWIWTISGCGQRPDRTGIPSCPFPWVPSWSARHPRQLFFVNGMIIHLRSENLPLAAFMLDKRTSVGFPYMRVSSRTESPASLTYLVGKGGVSDTSRGGCCCYCCRHADCSVAKLEMLR